jgi:hypothetical protein
MLERSGVLRNYSSFVSQLWNDENLLENLQANPRGVLNEHGFEIPEDAKVTLIVSELNTEGSPATQADLYAEGAETGEYKFIVPLKPDGVELEDIPLSEDVLELMAGGAMEAGCCPCCCCCPCCDGGSELQAN